MIFEQDTPCMLKVAMETLIDIANWYALLSDTFIWMYNAEKPLHVLLKFALDILVMQEVPYHISVGLTSRLHRKKKAPWPAVLLCIGLYEIRSFKHVDVEAEQMKKYPFDLQSYNLYDPHCILKDHCARVQFNWIHRACHWVEENPWRYCYNSSRLNELVDFTVEWLVEQRATASRRALKATTVAEVNIPVCHKGKRKVSHHMEEEKSLKFQADPLVEKSTMTVEEKCWVAEAPRNSHGA